MEQTDLTGFLFINKPIDISSFSCVRTIKQLLPKKTRVGHTGTLDNFATGLLIICIGRQATRLAGSLLNLDKQYAVRAKLGELSDTLDRTGTVLESGDASHITEQDLQAAITVLGSSYSQVPPIYSALKHEGAPLYELVRKGKATVEKLEEIVEKKRRIVQLHEISLISYKAPFFSFTAHVSKGTYIRSLANDIAEQCGTHATTYDLQRTAIGPIRLEEATPLDYIKSIEDVEKHLISLEAMNNRIQNYQVKKSR